MKDIAKRWGDKVVVEGFSTRILRGDRLAVVGPLSVTVGCGAGWRGLAASYEASVHHGLRLASGATVVLALVALYVLAYVAGIVRRRVRA